jgi:hypothetical protein
MIGGMSEALNPWHQIRRRLGQLPPDRQAVMALASAEHLVTLTASDREGELRRTLALGWAALTTGPRDLSELRNGLEDRDDVDDDEVAAVAFALGAVMGSLEDAWWTVNRCCDAAFDRVPYPEDTTSFRPLDEDAGSPQVRRELEWQLAALSTAEESDSLATAIARLRPLAQS